MVTILRVGERIQIKRDEPRRMLSRSESCVGCVSDMIGSRKQSDLVHLNLLNFPCCRT
jgi:hypothetical protein